MSKTRAVVIAARSVKDHKGKTHKQGVTVNLPDAEARDLVRNGLARHADTKPTPDSPAEKGGK